MRSFLSILSFLVMCFTISAQTDTIINGRRYKAVEDESSSENNKKHTPPLDSTFVLNNKKFKYYNTWLTVGAGWQQNLTYKRNAGFTGGLDFNFHVKQHYFQLGTNITGEKFGFYNNYQFHFGYGKRHENKSLHYAGFVGVSYSFGQGKVDSVYIRPYNQPGLYGQAEIIKKIAYDVGVGTSLFVDWNREQTLIGLRFIIYFSGAYKGIFNDQYRGK